MVQIGCKVVKLFEALQVTSTDVVAFVGGGGKTSAMFRLAAELAAAGEAVLTTTTTRIFAAQTRLAPVHVQSLPDLLAACTTQPNVLLTGPIEPEVGKAFGVEPEQICAIKAQLPGRAVIIEADGSRMRPFKAPADHEPVIPDCTTLVVPVVGIDAVGLPLTSEKIHRPEQVAAIWPGPTVTTEMVAHVLGHPQGSRKGVPTGARFIPLINKVETAAEAALAEEIARILLDSGAANKVLVGAISRAEQPLKLYVK